MHCIEHEDVVVFSTAREVFDLVPLGGSFIGGHDQPKQVVGG